MGQSNKSKTNNTIEKTAAIYVRISLDQGYGEMALDRQEKECRQRAARDEVEVPADRVYSDLSISAADARKTRPAYDRLLSDVRAGLIDRVYVWDLDRLTRQPKQLGDWVEFAEQGLCHIVEAHGMDLDLSTPGGLLVARIRVAVAENESKHKGERQRAAMRQRAELGIVPMGNRPTGYTHAGEVIEHEAAAVRAVFDAFLAGASLKSIARALSGEKEELTGDVPTLPRPSWTAAVEWNERHPDREQHELPPEQPWNSSAVLKMLRNPRYAGFATYIPTEMGKNGSKTAKWHNRRVRDPRTGEWVRGQWEPIVDDETWERAQRILDDPARKIKVANPGTRISLGSGLFRCPVCHGRVHRQGRSYTCTGHANRIAAPVDEFVENVIVAVLSRPDFRELVCVSSSDQRVQTSNLEAEIVRLRGRIERAEKDYADDLIRADDLKRVRDMAEARILEVEMEISTIKSTQASSPVFREVSPAEAYRSADLETRRAVIDLLCDVYITKTDRAETARRNGRRIPFDPTEAVRFEWKTAATPPAE